MYTIKKIFRSSVAAFLIVQLCRKNYFAIGRMACRRTDLCIEGLPSSGNSYLVNYVRHLNPDLILAHHLHAVCALKSALAVNVATFVIIRNPLDNIASQLSRWSDESTWHQAIGQKIDEYIDYHKYVSRHLDAFRIVPFDTVKSDIEGALEIVEKHSKFEMPHCNLSALNKKILESMRKWHLEYGISKDGVPLPDAKKSESRATLKNRIKAHKAFARAQKIYEQLLEAKF